MFPDMVTLLRKKTGLSQKQLAQMLNVSIDSVRRWEQGKRSPDVATLSKIAQIFNVTVSYLVEDPKEEEDKNSSKNASALNTKLIDDASFVKEGDLIGSGRVLFYKDDNGKTFILPATQENQIWFREFMTKTITA